MRTLTCSEDKPASRHSLHVDQCTSERYILLAFESTETIQAKMLYSNRAKSSINMRQARSTWQRRSISNSVKMTVSVFYELCYFACLQPLRFAVRCLRQLLPHIIGIRISIRDTWLFLCIVWNEELQRHEHRVFSSKRVQF